MPHAKPTFCSLYGPTSPGLQRTQAGVTELVVDIVDQANRTANAKQALNQMFDGNGKATGGYQFASMPVWHASSGNGQHSVCLFYTLAGSTAQILAIGAHRTSTSYTLEWGPTTGPFSNGSTISL